MKRFLSLAAAVLLAALPAAAADKPREGKSETIKLFDGKTLDGWEGHEKLWSVKLLCSDEPGNKCEPSASRS